MRETLTRPVPHRILRWEIRARSALRGRGQSPHACHGNDPQPTRPFPREGERNCSKGLPVEVRKFRWAISPPKMKGAFSRGNVHFIHILMAEFAKQNLSEDTP